MTDPELPAQKRHNLEDYVHGIKRFEKIIERWEDEHQGTVRAYRASLEALHGEAFRRLIIAFKNDPSALMAMKSAIGDELVYSVFRSLGIIKPSLREREELLDQIANVLDSGLQTITEPFPETQREFAEILDQLRRLPPNDIKGRLVIAGFQKHPYGPEQQRCQECIYYLVHRQWCDIPEISLPAKPDWWCRLWRI